MRVACRVVRQASGDACRQILDAIRNTQHVILYPLHTPNSRNCLVTVPAQSAFAAGFAGLG